MENLTCLLIVLILNFASAKVVPIIYEKFEMCVEPENRAGKFDFSQLEYIAESDTVVFANGTWKFLEEVKSPWKATLFTEKFIRGQWSVEAFFKKIDDFCKVIQDPTQPWYPVTSKFEHKKCPFPAGVSFEQPGSAKDCYLIIQQTEIHFDMVKMNEVPFVFPPTFEGEWRLNFVGEFGGDKKECFQIRFDLVDI